MLHKPSQNVTQKVFSFVPNQDFSIEWSDEKLYKKYGLTESEISFIEMAIRPMNLVDNSSEELEVEVEDDE
jgi:site-specific DNA-methyltransferase (adenine-specific)